MVHVLQIITQTLILAIVNLILKSLFFLLLEIYFKISPLYKVEYFSQKDFFIDIRNHIANNKFTVTINSLKLIKVYLVYN